MNRAARFGILSLLTALFVTAGCHTTKNYYDDRDRGHYRDADRHHWDHDHDHRWNR